MERDSSGSGVAHKVGSGAIGTLIAVYAVFDVIPIALVAVGLTAWFERPWLLFLITAVALIVINIACCRWIQRHWDAWIASSGRRVEAKLEQLRSGAVMRHPVAWITRDSDWWFALATAIVNPIIVVAAARIIGGRPITERQIVIAVVAYAVPMAAVFTFAGYELGEALRG